MRPSLPHHPDVAAARAHAPPGVGQDASARGDRTALRQRVGAPQRRVAGERHAGRRGVLRPPERLIVVPVVVDQSDPSWFDAAHGVVRAVHDVALNRDPVSTDVRVDTHATGVVHDVAPHDRPIGEGRPLGGRQLDPAAVRHRPNRVENQISYDVQPMRRPAPDSRVRHVVDLVVCHGRIGRSLE